MSFRRGWLRRGCIYSDEGFSVGIVDKTGLLYREGRRKMTIGGELLVNGFVVYQSSIGPWNDGAAVDDAKRTQIVRNITRALESQGLSVDID